VHVARANPPFSRLPRASAADLELLMADSVGRAAKLVGATKVVHFANSADDARTSLLERAGVPLSVLRGGGPDPAEHLAALVNGAASMETAAWSPADKERETPRFLTCSVQRWRRPQGMTALDVARAYFTWLPGAMPLVRTQEREGVFSIFNAGVRVLVLRHVPGRSDADSAWLEVADGALYGGSPRERSPRLEFRCLLDGQAVMAALLDYQPALPFFVYRFTQALLHERTMRQFGAWLEAKA